MSKSVVTQYQPSITEWFASIGSKYEANAFREEDNLKVYKSETLWQTIGLPYERPEKYPAKELTACGPVFLDVLKNRGNELCALRLVPKREGLPKLRDRGQTIKDCYENWFKKLNINPDDYDVYICPHCDNLLWSAIFVVKKDLIFGEIIKGMHSQLTQGNTVSKSYQFIYDFKNWQWSGYNQEAQNQIKKMLKYLYAPDKNKQSQLKKSLNSKFSHDYIVGYFETTVWPGDKIYFIDYNRLLPDYIASPPNINDLCATCEVESALSREDLAKRENTSEVKEVVHKSSVNQKIIIKGAVAYAGKVSGNVVKVNDQNLNLIKFPTGSVLVCDNTDVRYLPMMKKAAAIVTDRGGILSHAAIIARELHKPCLINTKIATKILQNGDYVLVDANKGIIAKLKDAK